MKQYLRPYKVVIGSMVVALLAGGGMAAVAKVSHTGARSTAILLQAEQSPEPAENPEARDEAAPAPEVEDQDEAAEEEAAEDEDEAAEDENEPAEVQPPAQPPAPAPTVTTRTFNLVGGTVTFRCSGNAISLVSAVPAAGFSMETEIEDGGTELKVRFENDSHRSEIRASCSAGQVVANEIREENR